MLLIYKNLKCIDFKNKKLIKVFFIHTETHKVKRGEGAGLDEVFAELRGHHCIKFGNHCICLSFLNLYLYENFIIYCLTIILSFIQQMALLKNSCSYSYFNFSYPF
jgi:hypothetical protein